MSQEQMVYSQATGTEIADIIDSMRVSLIGKPETSVMMACITLAILLQSPNMPLDRLIEGVKGTSEYIALWASSLDGPVMMAN